MRLSRRKWIQLAGAFGATAAWGKPVSVLQRGPLFIEVPPSSTGIHWIHENAMSPKRYLPETMGPGCAFLDFDNDGWMDLFLVTADLAISGNPQTRSVTPFTRTTETAPSRM